MLRKGHLFHSHLSFISLLRHNFISVAQLHPFRLSNHVIMIIVIIMELKLNMPYILLDCFSASAIYIFRNKFSWKYYRKIGYITFLMTITLLVTLLREICMVGCCFPSPHPSVFVNYTRPPIPGSGSHRPPSEDYNHQMSNSRSTSYITEINKLSPESPLPSSSFQPPFCLEEERTIRISCKVHLKPLRLL